MAPQPRPGAVNSLQWQRLADAAAVATTAAEMIRQAAAEAIGKRGRFSLVLAGGTTPAACYQLLAAAECDWPHWHLYFGDERCLPADHPQRNSHMASQTLTQRVAIPADQIHPIPAEQGAEAAARSYQQLIETLLPFDLVLLGIGEDGHTASLFPGHRHAPERLVVAVHDAPKPPPNRVSLTAAALNNCRRMLILVTGSSKSVAVAQWRNKSAQLPVSTLSPLGEGIVLTDSAAWPYD